MIDDALVCKTYVVVKFVTSLPLLCQIIRFYGLMTL